MKVGEVNVCYNEFLDVIQVDDLLVKLWEFWILLDITEEVLRITLLR